MAVFARWVVRHRRAIAALALVFVVPCLYGLRHLQIEYDLFSYLPSDTASVIGQRVLNERFGFGSSAYLLVKDKPDWEVQRIKEKVAAVPGVAAVTWLDDVTDITIPRSYQDQTILRQFFSDGATLLQIVFKKPGADLETRTALTRIQKMLAGTGKLTGQTAALAQMRNLADQEKPRMLLISIALVMLVLLLTIPSPVVPFLFLLTLGFAVVVNLGLNYFLGSRLSYLTNSVASALQLGVSLDFCIFLWERFREERLGRDKAEAMEIAIRRTSTAVLASSITTVLGFAALAAMRNGLGADLGITMARGVLLSLLSCVTLLPALLLLADRYIFAWQHRSILPDLQALAHFVPKFRVPLFLVFVLLFIPAYYGYSRVRISYDILSTYPDKLPAIAAAEEMRRAFGGVDTLNLITREIEPYELEEILAKLERLPGINQITAYHRLVDPAIPVSFVPERLRALFTAGGYCNSTILLADKAASPRAAATLAEAARILRPYRGRAYLTGQAALVWDSSREAKADLPRVNRLSLFLIALTLALSFASISLPAILIGAVQLAIWFNQGIAYFTGNEIFYFGTIAIGAIQLGTTVDYAVLLTSRFREELSQEPPLVAMTKALRESARAVLTSAGTLFVATMGIYAGTSLDLVRGLIVLIARGALITVAVVLLVFPSALLLLNGLIGLTTLRWPRRGAAKAQ